MGLLYQKKHDENEDGKTAIFTDFFTAPPVSEGTDLEHTNNKDTETPSEKEDSIEHGKKEQR